MWKKGQSGNPAGRPRKALAELEQSIELQFEVSLSKEDKFTIIESLLEMPIADLKALAKSPQTPAFVVVAASAIAGDIQRKKLDSINDLFDRFFGKPKQTMQTEFIQPSALRIEIVGGIIPPITNEDDLTDSDNA